MNCATEHRLFKITAREPLLSTEQIAQLQTLLLRGSTANARLAPEASRPPTEDKALVPPPNNPAGITYLGQFITHDIVPSTRPTVTACRVSPLLNLDSVYGHIPTTEIPPRFDAKGDFIHSGEVFDVHRVDGIAAIPESRNDENVIIVQLHRQIQMLHNKVVARVEATDVREKIHKAKAITTTLFHIAVITEFCEQILDQPVYQQYFHQTCAHILDLNTPMAGIPLEFSHGAFRFGHSLVRSSYTLKNNDAFPLSALLRGKHGGAVDPKFAIDWRLFFGEEAQEASALDMLMASGMGAIPACGTIILRNLMAGESKKIPSGFAIRDCIQQRYPTLAERVGLTASPVLHYDTNAELLDAYIYLNDHFEHRRLPLWLYVLRESVLSSNKLNALGKVGSIIVAEVVRSAIVSCYPNSQLDSAVPLAQWLSERPYITAFLQQHAIPTAPTSMLDLLTLFD